MNRTQKAVAACGGDTWVGSLGMVAIWPWPPVIVGVPRSRFTEDDYRFLCTVLRPGDFILSRAEPFKLSNWAIGRHGTAFIHLAVYTGTVRGQKDPRTGFVRKPKRVELSNQTPERFGSDTHIRTITHAVSEGVICEDILRLLNHSDRVAVVRPYFSTLQQVSIISYALRRVGQPYNFDFTDKGPPATYCTELGRLCCEHAGIEPPARVNIPVTLFGPFGKKGQVTLADSFIERFGLLACSMSCNDRPFWRRSYLGDQLREFIAEAPDAASPR